jgi:serine/threonine-protein kinase
MKLDVWLEEEPSTAARLKVIASLSRALADSHRRGLVLGGLAPSHVDVDSDGTAQLEASGLGPGSPYEAPEVAQGGPQSPKADIYSAAAVFYEVLTGKPPFQSDPPRPLQEARPDLSQDLTDAVTACMERDPEWRPADLSYLQAVVQKLQKDAVAPGKAQSPRPAAAPRASGPPRTFLDPAPRRRHDDRSALTRALPVVLVLVAIAGTGAAGLWYYVLRPGRSAPAAARTAPSPVNRPGAAAPESSVSPPPANEPLALPSRVPDVAAPSPAAASPPAGRAAASPAIPTTTEPKASARPSPSSSPRSAPPSALPTPEAAPTPVANPGKGDAAPPSLPEPAPVLAPTEAPPAQGQDAGPGLIRTVAPFRLRAGALQVLDVHGSGLRSDHQARIVPLRKREAAAGFMVTRYQLRSAALLLVFVQVDAAVRPGKYALSLVDGSGAETNAFAIEVVNK